MFNLKKLKIKKRLSIAGLLILGIMLGIGVKSISVPKVNQTIQQNSSLTNSQPTIKQSDVQKFLIAYYTKKDLGENQNRYQGFMTQAAFQAETAKEAKPENQAYKGYVVNQVFDDAKIYIDQADQQALVTVDYHNTQLVNKTDNPSQTASTSKSETLLLTYATEKGQALVNNIQRKTLSDASSNDQPQDLNQVRSAHDDQN
ncbi:hypothetical protein R55227_BLOPHJLP_01549 [Fructobacillus tropaeoli]|uniref:hypothetical protein n=1 Tax=Fructobacillus tropaeoli TaxID=709323 RepID=UPI002D9D1404|nr:hypothetical protein R55227_BLOPHJLP_01549 [Fructobacillus tropaeoli]